MLSGARGGPGYRIKARYAGLWDAGRRDPWPAAGDFGFVWGCVWGDDSSWKVQNLDLSAVQDGVIRRDERFGYLKLMSLRCGDRVAGPPPEGQWDVRFGTGDAAAGWDQLALSAGTGRCSFTLSP